MTWPLWLHNFGPHLYDLATLAADAVMKGAVH